MKWKIMTAVLALLLLVTNGWHVYRSLDQGVTLMYRDQVLYELANRLKATTTLANIIVKGKPEAEAMGLLKQLFPGERPFVKEGTINADWVTIKLGSGNVAQGLELDESVSEWALPAAERPAHGSVK